MLSLATTVTGLLCLGTLIAAQSPTGNQTNTNTNTNTITGLPASLYVDNAPDHLRPYVIRQYATAQSTVLRGEVFRFYITGPSSNNAFTLVTVNAPQNAVLNVLPHIHERHFENFYNYKGRFQLWAQGEDNTTQETRVLTQGDFGAVVRNSTHTFQMMDPDSQMGGAIVPGGFEAVFFAIGKNRSSTTHTPYDPHFASETYPLGSSNSTMSGEQSFDVYNQPQFTPRRDALNGTAPANTTWHDGPNALAPFGQPYFIANGFGPKFINNETGYQIIQPLVTAEQSGDLNFTTSTISLSTTPENVTIPTWQIRETVALQVLEGMLWVQIAEYDVAVMTVGDVALVPGGVQFRYWTETWFAKMMVLCQGSNGVDSQLIARGGSYDAVVFPNEWV
ncbi:quercetin 2,3-dioxygenase anaerobically complexed with the substrate kaempferol [Aspergillus heteromorphus CBS 117.55]|uniref:Quercetin 2,3-dioxygenase anaerobically complexed with the substrate kaempferol n=1 Tax=Aspergillus heteromorphus CBS 117.55 TaxID=1448321 RepID=A0A317W3K5_9EURO|nr:quercetin 2,3-dioxygenase anaerobically complexed with the substrate kaempferol [Aspergillus heteromorphus CBS 117.55]PWY79698.1 quercetin 2,3-dioxygenase anaerobically complexed with the substrate kaempferol [Aspergillus heteromorphus CBS 117.55]